MADKVTASAIFKYLFDQNRPYSVTDIHMNLHKEFGKTAVQKGLDMLVGESKVREKVYGKQKVYAVNQELYPKVDDAEIKSMDIRISQLTSQLSQEESSLRGSEARLKTLTNSLTLQQANDALNQCEVDIGEKSDTLARLKQMCGTVTTADRRHVQQHHHRAVGQWRKRKRIATNIVDAIMEGYPKKKRDLDEEVGLETDQDVGVTLPT